MDKLDKQATYTAFNRACYTEEDVDRVRDFRLEHFRWYLRLRRNKKLYVEMTSDKAGISLPRFEEILDQATNQIKACSLIVSYVIAPDPYQNKTAFPAFPPLMKHEISRAKQYLDNPSWREFMN